MEKIEEKSNPDVMNLLLRIISKKCFGFSQTSSGLFDGKTSIDKTTMGVFKKTSIVILLTLEGLLKPKCCCSINAFFSMLKSWWRLSKTETFLRWLSLELFFFRFFFWLFLFSWCVGGCPRGVMVKAMDYGIVVSSYSSRAITFIFGQIPLGKVWTPLSSQLWVK